MPYQKSIADLNRRLEATQAEIARQRALLSRRKAGAGDADATLEKLLAALAKLRAERLRLMTRQRLV